MGSICQTWIQKDGNPEQRRWRINARLGKRLMRCWLSSYCLLIYIYLRNMVNIFIWSLIICPAHINHPNYPIYLVVFLCCRVMEVVRVVRMNPILRYGEYMSISWLILAQNLLQFDECCMIIDQFRSEIQHFIFGLIQRTVSKPIIFINL